MKRIGSLFLAAVLALTMGVSALAAVTRDEAPVIEAATDTTPRTTFVDTGDDILYLPDPGAGVDNAMGITASPMMVLTGENTVSWVTGEIIAAQVVKGSGGAPDEVYVIPPERHLEPATEYSFQLFFANGDEANFDVTTDAATKLTAITTSELTATGKMRLRAVKGTGAVSAAAIKTKGSGTAATYHFEITTKDTYGTRLTDVAYTFYTTGTPVTGGVAKFVDGGAAFQVGHRIMTDEEISVYAEGDIITIMRDVPVFTRRQMDTVAKAYNYKSVEFEGEDASWRYLGRVSGMGDTNFFYTHDVIPTLMNRFDQDFKFLTFPAGVTFPTNGELFIDVSDVSYDWERIYTYLYRDGTLTRINTTYDAINDEIHFRTNYLGAFVMTDVEITDTTIIQHPAETSVVPTAPESVAPESIIPPTIHNPNTGAGMPIGLNLVMGLGMVSLLTAGSVIIRKKK